MFDYAAGLSYYAQALRLAPAWAVQTRERARMGTAQMHNMLGNRAEAFAALDEAQDVFHRTGNRRAEADALLLRGFFLDRNGQTVAALEPYRQALALREQLGGDADIINALTHLCGTLSDLKRLSEALPLCERATRMAEATDSQFLRWDAYWISADAHAAAGDYRLAYEHQQRATQALKKHARLTLIGLTGAMRERFDVERQRMDNERLTAQLSGEQDERGALRRLVWLLGAVAAALAVALVWVWRRRQDQRGPAQAALNGVSAL
jgi:tetratricopeptide (TPR) repeat protein